jgi:1-phosphofructokinase family hexose kinase
MIDPQALHGLEDKLQEWMPEAVLVVLGGSLPPGAPSDTYARLITWAKQNEVRTILDTSGDALVEGVKAQPYMIKPNATEAEQLLGRPLPTEDDVIAGGQELLQRGIEIVVISLGKRGALAISRSGVWKAVPPEVAPETTTGAGDSMVAGFAIAISEHKSLAEGLALGTAAATATVMAPGTELARQADVESLLPRVKVEQLT